MNDPWKMSVLKKQGHNVQKNWADRFVAIKENKFAYYKSTVDFESAKPINIIYLGKEVSLKKVGELKFEIKTTHKDYYFQCPSTESINAWMDLIERGIQFDENKIKLVKKDSGGKSLENRIKYSSWLYKRGGKNRNSNRAFKKRWTVLQNGIIVYYEAKKDNVAKGVIKLTDILKVQETPQLQEDKNNFEIIMKNGNVYTLYALLRDELENWIDAIKSSLLVEQDRYLVQDNDSKLIKEGSLLIKQSVEEHSWKQKWVEIRGKRLKYKGLESDSNYQASIDLSGACFDIDLDEDIIILKVTDDRTLILKTKNPVALTDWFESLKSLKYFGVGIKKLCELNDTTIPK
eukprot:Pgem_evm1s2975